MQGALVAQKAWWFENNQIFQEVMMPRVTTERTGVNQARVGGAQESPIRRKVRRSPWVGNGTGDPQHPAPPLGPSMAISREARSALRLERAPNVVWKELGVTVM